MLWIEIHVGKYRKMVDIKTIFEVEVTGLVYGGDGIGRLPDGRAVFVPFVLPGERVKIRVVEQRRGHARADLLEVLKPSEQRITPRCIHFSVCGGCHYQHMPYELQLEVKEKVLREQLARIGGIQDAPVQKMKPSPNAWNYRNTVQFQLTDDSRLGFYRNSGHEVFPLQVCYLPEEGINVVWPQIELEPVPGLERVEMRQDASEEVLVIFESTISEAPAFEVDFSLSAVHMGPDGPVVLSGDERIVIDVLGKPFQVSAGSFFQVNTAQAGEMVRHVLDRLGMTPDSVFIDVYCGVGLFSAFAASQVARCIGIEVSPYACEDFADNLDPYENVELYQGTAEEILPALDLKPDFMVVDPPRAGLEKTALDAIVAMHPKKLVYVSCDPATLARDLKRLVESGYHLDEVTPFDLFPQTYHIESISLLSATIHES
jgi:23S rRNA (uracil1939-C5)-methyltransferase